MPNSISRMLVNDDMHIFIYIAHIFSGVPVASFCWSFGPFCWGGYYQESNSAQGRSIRPWWRCPSCRRGKNGINGQQTHCAGSSVAAIYPGCLTIAVVRDDSKNIEELSPWTGNPGLNQLLRKAQALKHCSGGCLRCVSQKSESRKPSYGLPSTNEPWRQFNGQQLDCIKVFTQSLGWEWSIFDSDLAIFFP